MIIDDSLNVKKSVKIFDSTYDLQYSNMFRVVLFDSSFIIAESAPIKGLYLSTGSNLIFHKISLDLDSLSCENFNPIFDEFPAVEMNSMLNESDHGLSYAYFKNINLNLSSPDHLMIQSAFYDFDECLWPRYSIYSNNKCSFPMPEFNLNNITIVEIGTNKPKIIEYLPFISTQKAKFLIKITCDSDLSAPNWTQVNENNMTVSLLLDKIVSVGTIKINFEAQLITVSIPVNNYLNYKTQKYSSVFNFNNNNCVLINIVSQSYIVINKLTTFSFMFSDDEADNIIVNMNSSDFVSSYITFDKKTSISQIFLNSNAISEDPVILIFYYTDSYHQDESFINNVTLSVNLFESEPPVFDSPLKNVNANRCQNTEIILPSFSDPDAINSNDRISIKFDKNTPNWIMLGSNNSLLLDTTNILNKIDNFSSITIILIDSTNAFTKYKMNITVDPLVTPTFQIKTTFYLKCTTSNSISIDAQSQSEIDVVDCDNKNQINSASFDTKEGKVNINFESYLSCRSICVQLMSRDSCNQSVFSDKYIIYFDDGQVPAVTNAFGPISVFRGISKLFVVPSDLFTDSQNLTLTLDVTNCINKSSINTSIKIIQKNTNEKYLFVQSNDTFSSCLFEIYATNVYGRSSQYQAQINIIHCASKDCIECTGSFQSDCVKCKDGYTVGDNGVCLLSFSLFSFNQFTIYRILSLIICFLLFLHLVFIIKLKRLSFHSLLFVQPILIMIF